ncbi:Kinetochore protein NDC80 homolog [Babesia bigemina]|uniref:Kinetochore protein NDC80 n=1 Tax=Babesia bigemina TaxID=5866 RepID=A0A061DA97_BABBI|nr:Kinetochore protein NDC80 homolog [Babesia bigemina]CDR95794.1 Kinetochore protein NDC80 homolog [Babesia bigemina]|eukprot:XP_012767980.1 Kinetochore protein NDC80 homolog [Babesia bigemina]
MSSLRNFRSALDSQTSSTARHQAQPAAAKSPLTNKRECVQCILAFLAARDFHPCTAKELLRSPPLQTLLDIWNFLFSYIDPNAHITKENMAVEVPKFFKEFGYPHIMKTSHLRTPTADHQWEANLVALSWLCKLLLYEQECFDKPFEVTKKRHGSPYMGLDFGAHGKATISNTMVAQFVTEQATKHFQLYLKGEENSVQLVEQFHRDVTELVAGVQDSVDGKIRELEELRGQTLELQEELESFARTKEWIEKANVELQRIEELTASVRGTCVQAAETLKRHKQTLRDEEAALAAQEEQNADIEKLIEQQDINKNVVQELNNTIRALKVRIADGNRKIKELEHDIASSKTTAQTMESQLVRLQKALASTHESIRNFLVNNGRHAESWRSLGQLRINPQGINESEILGVEPATYNGVLQDVINKDREATHESSEARTELEQANQHLEALGNEIARETSEILRETSSLIKNQHVEEKDARVQLEASELAAVIRAAANDELVSRLDNRDLRGLTGAQESTKRELEAVEAEVAVAHAQLQQQDAAAQEAWQVFVNRFKEMFQIARSSKESNCHALRGDRRLIGLEHRLFSGGDDTQHEAASETTC